MKYTFDQVMKKMSADEMLKRVNCHDDLLSSCHQLLAVFRLQNGNLHEDVNAIQEAARTAIAAAEEKK